MTALPARRTQQRTGTAGLLLRLARRLGRRHRGRGAAERGSVSLLTIGFLAVGLMLLVVAVDVAAVQLARTQLWDAADGAALDGSDALARDVLYDRGLGADVPVTDATVGAAAQRYLAGLDRPRLVTSWRVDGAAADGGQGAVVRVTGHVDLPLVGPVVEAFSDGVTITVESHARARTSP